MSESAHVIGEANAVAVEAAGLLDWPRHVAYAIFAALVVLVAATFLDYGISWDEMLQNTYGHKLLDYYISGFRDRSAFSYANLYLYGGLFDIVAAAVNLVSPFGEYETRHLLGGVFFIVGLIGAWKLADLLAGSRAALIALMFLASTPLLYGHAFINPKDSPFAWLLVWVIYYGCRILAVPGRPQFGTLTGFALALGLALGTRVIAFAFVAYIAAILSLYVWVKHTTDRSSDTGVLALNTWRVELPLAAAMPLALAVMAVFWPWSIQAPFNILDALRTFSHFTWHPLVLWSGELVPSTQLPWAYLTRLLGVQLPEYVLVGIALSSIFAVQFLRRNGIASFLAARPRQYLYLAVCAVMPLVAFMIMRPVVYNGVRHFLFIVPPLIILSAIAVDKALTLAMRRSRKLAVTLAGCLALGLVWQVSTLVRLHPYEYVGYNAVAGGLSGAKSRFELDYWGTSLGEAARGLSTYVVKNHLADGGTKRNVFVCGDRMSAAYFLPHNLHVTERLSDADFYIGINAEPCRDHFDDPKNALYAVRRDGATLSYVLELHATPSAGPASSGGESSSGTPEPLK